ncbi:iron-containing alcohol dehydrogenase [Shewanella psychropiezotolerans]|uniref:iron-containing alcohol dehydrogenase n=1 Tax=Shewanella psychropiezotolerans TaxID=2593655 RepID=UPI002D21B249|nr:iron-containing alcohol dehydrogenase [Shewanella psychropiezotolerans]
MLLQANWNYPTDITVGEGCIKQVATCCLELEMTQVLLVTDPGLAKLPMVQEILDICVGAGLVIEVFCDIQANPTGGIFAVASMCSTVASLMVWWRWAAVRV